MNMKKNIRTLRLVMGIMAVLLFPAVTGNAQPFSNSWISFSNSYYKFRIVKEGIYRITKTQLDALGMGTVTGNQFAVFREGKEVPVYTSTSGAFGPNDYIELYATRADGKIDSVLYPNPYYQPAKNINLLSDTAFYFLTYDNSVHERMSLVNNSIPSPAPSPAAWCWTTAYPAEDPRTTWAPGQSHNLIQQYGYFYSSDYDLSEGYSYTALGTAGSLHINTPQAFTGGPQASMSVVIASHSIVPGVQFHPTVTLNGNGVFDTVLNDRFRLVKRSVGISPASLSAANTAGFSDGYNFFVEDANIRYPRAYNFSGNFSQTASFDIPAGDRYLEIAGFTTGGQTPRLYDRTNNKIYTGTESGGTVKFYLDASVAARSAFLTNEASLTNISSFRQVQFRNYSTSANQGNYIILSHKDYINASPSYVNEFSTYRKSITGGSYTPVVVDVTELYDQFGYGYEFHPIGVRNFVDFAVNTWTQKPGFMFIIGKGLNYTSYPAYLQSPTPLSYPAIPTWGDPGSDNLLTSFNNNQKPVLATGRLSAWNNQEIGDYLDKVKTYEAAIKPLDIPTVDHELWKKKALHIAGSANVDEQNTLLSSLFACENILKDTLIGGTVTTIKKSSTDPIEQVNNAIIDSLMNKGIGYVSFYGHGASSGFDYALNDPDNYHSSPRFPIFSAFACEVAHIFSFFTEKTVSEKYIASGSGGSIAMIAGNNSGWTSTLPAYMQNLYRSWSYTNYGNTLGEQYQKNIGYLQDHFSDNFMDIHTQCMLFQGDPGLLRYNPDKPDYAVEESGLSPIPVTVTTALDTFIIRAVVYDLGKSIRDSVWVSIRHTKPGNSTVLYSDSVKLPYLLYSDTLQFRMPLDPNNDIGLNNYTIKVDAGEKYDEISEMNNEATLQLFIYSENLVPVYPKEFAIVHEQGITLKASTLNAFAPLRNYRLEIDTTMAFNSSLKQSTTISSIGGLIKWKPTLNYQDSVVYYWRAAPDSLINNDYRWSESSFIYLANGSDGWNQSHYFQYKKDEPYNGLELKEPARKFKFGPVTRIFKVKNSVLNPNNPDYYGIQQSIDGEAIDNNYGCGFSGSIQVVVIDSVSGRAWRNYNSGLYGSIPYCYDSVMYPHETRMFEFYTNSPQSRNNARLFIESIPEKNYVMIMNLIHDGPPGIPWDGQVISNWQTDAGLYGTGNTLYDAIKNLGFDMIDQYTYKRVFAFFRQKGVPASIFPVTQKMSNGVSDKIEITQPFLSSPDTGMMQTSLVGPALEWESLKWRTSATDNLPDNDSPYVAVYGIDTMEQETLMYRGFARDTSLSFIDAAQYPNLKLRWYSVDNITRTSAHLDYWRVLYSPVPEAALNAAAHFEFADSLGEGQHGKLKIAIENLTPIPMDSMLVSYKIIDAGNIKHNLADKKYRKLPGNDTLIADLDFDISSYHGNNYIFIEANPANDQPEQYHPNNLGYLPVYMHADKYNPLLDVTFDGVHILDRDIVSAKPFIKVLMRDENRFLPLSDTSMLKVQLMYPDQTTPVNIPIDGTICKFFPADSVNSKKNEARIEYRPDLPQDGVYRLIVSGRDKVGNTAGNSLNYDVDFTVENKPSITNVLNYPNPFSTATRFVFTMTGSEIPSQFKIQILTVTGKIVREIKKSELGNLHIGRNITDYSWDGKDEYGQMLGNGVYLYRVITSIRGEDVEQRKLAPVDKFFKNGYGKLYIMR